jgi:cob(I)alamin adenosyltransferase
MYGILDRLLAFIQPAADQWDDHQARLEHISVQLLDMMRECRRPHDIQNEVRDLRYSKTADKMKIFDFFFFS